MNPSGKRLITRCSKQWVQPDQCVAATAQTVHFERKLFADLQALRKDRGGREIIRRCPELVELVELESGRPLEDMDTPADYRRLLGYTKERESEC